MKKIVVTIFSMFFLLCFPMISYAGDIPETLLHDEDALVFFGEITKMEEKKFTVAVCEVIKGKINLGDEFEYSQADFVQPKLGETYLCGIIAGQTSIYLWEVTGFDTKSLEIKQEFDMAKRMQNYLNEGKFDEAQKTLQDKETAVEESSVMNGQDVQTISIIGGADGPTSIFIAGKIGETKKMIGIGLLAILLIAAVGILIIQKKKKRG